MSKVVWHVTMSLDGFIAGPDHAMEWARDVPSGPNELAAEVMHSTGAILGGRGWYDAAARKYDGVDGIYGGAWSGPVFVLTHRVGEAPDDPKATFLDEDIEAAAPGRPGASQRVRGGADDESPVRRAKVGDGPGWTKTPCKSPACPGAWGQGGGAPGGTPGTPESMT